MDVFMKGCGCMTPDHKVKWELQNMKCWACGVEFQATEFGFAAVPPKKTETERKNEQLVALLAWERNNAQTISNNLEFATMTIKELDAKLMSLRLLAPNVKELLLATDNLLGGDQAAPTPEILLDLAVAAAEVRVALRGL